MDRPRKRARVETDEERWDDARATINAIDYPSTTTERVITMIYDALKEHIPFFQRPWKTTAHDILACVLAGRIPKALRSRINHKTLVPVVLNALTKRIDELAAEHDTEQRELLDRGTDSDSELEDYENPWTREDANKALRLLRPFVSVPISSSLLNRLCDFIPELAEAVLRDDAFYGRCDTDALRGLIHVTVKRIIIFRPDNADHELRMTVLKLFADKMSPEQLNSARDHPLLAAAYGENQYVPVWDVLLASWLTPCGTRMRLRDTQVVTDHAKPNNTRMGLMQALALIRGEGDTLRGSIEKAEAKNRATCKAFCDTLGESLAGTAGAVKPLIVLIASYLFDAAYLPHSRVPAATAAVAAVCADA